MLGKQQWAWIAFTVIHLSCKKNPQELKVVPQSQTITQSPTFVPPCVSCDIPAGGYTGNEPVEVIPSKPQPDLKKRNVKNAPHK